MKNIAFSAIIATCFVACAYALPAHRGSIQGENKWDALADLSLDMRQVILKSSVKVSLKAIQDNAVVGRSIASTVNASASEAFGILNQLDAQIRAQTLLLEEADVLFQQLNETGLALRENIDEDLKQLSVTAQIAITGILVGNRGAVTGLVVAARAILIVGVPGGLKVSSEPSNKYKALAKLSGDLRLVSNSLLNKVVQVADNDNKEIGSKVRGPVDASLESISSILDNLDSAISRQSLTIEEAEPLFDQYTATLAQVPSLIQEYIDLSSISAKVEIQGILFALNKASAGIIAASKAIITVGVPGGF